VQGSSGSDRAAGRALPGARPSPNIWHSPATYEIENRAFDRDGVLTRVMRDLGDWSGRDVLDIGCGTGFHLPVFAAGARTVTGVEPHADLLAIARRRTRRLDNVRVVAGLATALPLPAGSVDVVHARWAYFFGPGTEPGLAELDRVVRPGGVAFVVDNDPTRSTFGGWFWRGFPEVDPAAVEGFWATHGWSRERLDLAWTFDSRDDLEAVVRIELPTAVAEDVLAGHDGTGVDYAINLWWRRW
jgi:SAM-dependent methyltransferase